MQVILQLLFFIQSYWLGKAGVGQEPAWRACAFLTELWGPLPPCSDYWKRTQVSTSGGFPGHSAAKNLPAVQEMRVQLLHWEDPLEKERWRWQGVERESWQLARCPAAAAFEFYALRNRWSHFEEGHHAPNETTWDVPEWPLWEMAPADTKFPVSSWGYRIGHSRLCWEQQNGFPGIKPGRNSVVRG